eukprot:gb/GECG01016341.1/.p1 GENE.gb/GECG01016341.1/~~gb/GECG01016341.1/.p1  ORF type:complete len:141 (+),score=7.44 gb/GECG01016341.1/:1-423(+)
MSTIQRRYQRKRKPPRGWSYIEPVMTALESEMKDAIADPHEGKRRAQLLWPVYQINNQRSRYIYDMFYRYKLISRELYEYCLREKLADAALIAKWKKPGYDRLCCTHSINPLYSCTILTTVNYARYGILLQQRKRDHAVW